MTAKILLFHLTIIIDITHIVIVPGGCALLQDSKDILFHSVRGSCRRRTGA